MDMTTVDARYESDGATYDDLIDAAHEKGIKIIQDVVWNHTGNFGDATLCPMFTKEYNTIQEASLTRLIQTMTTSTARHSSRLVLTFCKVSTAALTT